MADYALIVNGVFQEIRNFPVQPENIPHKNVVWLPFTYEEAEYDPRNQYLSAYLERLDPDAYVKYRVAENFDSETMVSRVIEERERRLCLGFSYNFGDSRGIHAIGTTSQDMVGWDEVTKAASALVSLGLGTQPINVVTDTGPVEVTATEWLQIILAATASRQPIWAASFVLQSMDPIPANYADNVWWP